MRNNMVYEIQLSMRKENDFNFRKTKIVYGESLLEVLSKFPMAVNEFNQELFDEEHDALTAKFSDESIKDDDIPF